jgi:hypothetical protein
MPTVAAAAPDGQRVLGTRAHRLHQHRQADAPFDLERAQQQRHGR